MTERKESSNSYLLEQPELKKQAKQTELDPQTLPRGGTLSRGVGGGDTGPCAYCGLPRQLGNQHPHGFVTHRTGPHRRELTVAAIDPI